MANRYWVGGTGNWTDTAHWSSSSGGSSGASVPSSADDVFFDENSLSADGDTITLNTTFCECRDFDNTALVFTPLVETTDGNQVLRIAGDLTLRPDYGLTIDAGDGIIYMTATAADAYITSNSSLLFAYLVIDTPNVVHLADAFFSTAPVQVGTNILFGDQSGFHTNDHPFQCETFLMLRNADDVQFGSSDVVFYPDVTGVYNGLAFHSDTLAANFDAGTSNITIVGDPFNFSMEITAWATGTTFYNLSIVGPASGRTFTIDAPDFTSNLLNFTRTGVVFEEGMVITTSIFTVPVAPEITQFRSSSDGVQYTISASVAALGAIDVKDCYADGAAIPFNNTISGIDSGNNDNWLFPATGPDNEQVLVF